MLRAGEKIVHRIWYGGSPAYILLLPFSWIFRFASSLRRHLYSSGILKTRRLSVPVIVVGNVTAGGTGKTPLTLWLARSLGERGETPAIVSRGYPGDVGAEPVVVTPESDPKEVGDEAILLAARSGCPT